MWGLGFGVQGSEASVPLQTPAMFCCQVATQDKS